jgi:hypothetical protein
MVKRSLSLALAAAVAVGCGGGGGGGGDGASADTPKGAVQAFVGDVGRGDWKAACALVDPMGQPDLVAILLKFSEYDAELDEFSQLKDCPASLEKHAVNLRAALEGADPGATRQKDPTHAVVSSPKGNWTTVLAEKPTSRWLIAGVPHTPR